MAAFGKRSNVQAYTMAPETGRYEYQIMHKAGKTNCNAEAFSRNPSIFDVNSKQKVACVPHNGTGDAQRWPATIYEPKERSKRYYDRKINPRNFKIADKVLLLKEPISKRINTLAHFK